MNSRDSFSFQTMVYVVACQSPSFSPACPLANAFGVADLVLVRPVIMSYMKLVTPVVLALFLFVGCGEKPRAVEAKDKDEARQSTKALEAADLVGYDGKRIRKNTDRILDANDKRNQDIQKTLDDNK